MAAKRADPDQSVPRPADTYDEFPADQTAAQLEDWLLATKVEPVSAIEWLWPRGFSVGPRIVEDDMWLCGLDGSVSGWVGREDATFSCGPGDLLLVPTRVEHYVRSESSDDLKLIALHFHAPVYGVVDLLALAGLPMYSGAADDSPYLRVSENLAREFARRNPGWRVALTAGITSVLLHVIRSHGCSPAEVTDTESQSDLRRIFPAVQLIEKDLGVADMRVGDLAKSVHLSEVQFRKLFKRTTGQSPVSFIRNRRVKLACSLLRQTDREIKDIAGECGFADVLFFHKVFKSEMGDTPTNYRNAEQP